MPTYDPRVISRSIDTLESEIQRFTDISSETSQQAGYVQLNYRERAERVLRWSAIVLDRALNDTLEVRAVNDEVDRLVIQCSEAVEIAHQTLANSEHIRTRSIATQDRWRVELQAALAWEARAEAELSSAKAAREKAESQVSRAMHALSKAESALYSCQSDSKRNCSGHQAAVGAARNNLATAQIALQQAEARVRAAEADLALARARVAQCRKSLAIADVAVTRSHQAVSIAIDSLARAESSLSDAHAAQRKAIEAQYKAIEAEELAKETVTRSRQAAANVDTAQTHLYQSIKFNDSAHNLAIRAKLDLDYRNEQLRNFNRLSSDIS